MVLRDKVCFALNGGLGDVIKGYYGSPHWGRVKAWKEANPECKLRIILCSHNPQAKEFLRFNPHIDVIDAKPAVHRPPTSKESPSQIILRRFQGDYQWINQYKPIMQYDYEIPEVYIENAPELEMIKSIKDSGPYIVVHPFAGGVVREVPRIEQYIKMVDRIIDELDMNVVVLGGTYKRVTEKETRKTKEGFPHNRDRLFNLVNKASSRVSVALTRESDGFLGTWSCMLCSVLSINMPIVTYIPSGRPAFTRGATYRNLKDKTKVIFTARKTNMKVLRDDTISWFKQLKLQNKLKGE